MVQRNIKTWKANGELLSFWDKNVVWRGKITTKKTKQKSFEIKSLVKSNQRKKQNGRTHSKVLWCFFLSVLFHNLWQLFQVSYAIGVAHPLSVSIFHYGTSPKSERELLHVVRENFDLRPGIIVRYDVFIVMFKTHLWSKLPPKVKWSGLKMISKRHNVKNTLQKKITCTRDSYLKVFVRITI